MFNIGFQEILIVLIAALVVLGPERIPSAARKLGKVFVQIRKSLRIFKETLRESIEGESLDE